MGYEESSLSKLADKLRDIHPLSERVKRASSSSLSELEVAAVARDGDPEVLTTLAKNRLCTPDILKELAEYNFLVVNIAVAANRKTSAAVLEYLSKDNRSSRLSRALIDHPSTPQHVLLQIAREDHSYKVHAHLAESERADEEILLALSEQENPVVLEAVAKNPRCGEQALSAVLKKVGAGAALSVAQNPGATNNNLREILELCPADFEVIRACLARPLFSEPFKRWVATSGPIQARMLLAGHALLSFDLFEALSLDEEAQVRMRLSANASLPKQFLLSLASDQDPLVRCGASSNPACHSELLEQLSSDPSEEVRRGVALHQSTSLPTLDLLAKDKEVSVREAVALNERTRLSTLEALASDEHEVARAVAKNPAAPKELLESLCSGEHADSEAVLMAVAANDNVTPDIIRLISEKTDEESVLLSCSLSRHAPDDVLLKLSKSTSLQVRKNVINNPSLTMLSLRKVYEQSRHKGLANLAYWVLDRRIRNGESSAIRRRRGRPRAKAK